jgi:magnesium transporter
LCLAASGGEHDDDGDRKRDGTTLGALLPFILRKCGLNPAGASAPFVATLVDVTGVVIYFNIARIIMLG